MCGSVKARVASLLVVMSLLYFGGSAGAGCPVADLSGDCRVNILDLAVLAEQWLEPPEQSADLNGDDEVDMLDLTLMAGEWNRYGIPLAINEFMASNSRIMRDPAGEFDDWIEIHNYGDSDIDIGGMYLTDDLNEPNVWRIPDDNPAYTTVPAHGYLLIWADGQTEQPGLHAAFALDADGEEIGLFASDKATLIDSVVFGAQSSDVSYGRYPDGEDNWNLMVAPTPRTQNLGVYLGVVDEVKFSRKHGFYDAPVSVTLATDTLDAVVYYTTDGTEPYEMIGRFPNGSVYTSPIVISKTTILRARAIKVGWKHSPIATQTYIFVSDVATQSQYGQAPGAGWPVGSVNGQVIDYGMDPDVVTDFRYSGLIDDALLAIPSISLVTKLKHLFDESEGIYVNAQGDGWWWERPTSVELINPDGSEGFQIDAGLRIRGGFSRSGGNPKHAFRLFFKPDYGPSELKFPLFGEEGVDEFDHVDLRTSQNYSWSFQGDGQNTMVREVFSRDLQGETGHPYTRSRYYHLYINGQYWGLYQTQERSEASYGASYCGGDKEDYDVMKVNFSAGRIMVATDGNADAYRRLYDAAMAGLSSTATYYRLQGMNTDGTRNPAYERLLDVDNLIDFMIIEYYTGDRDGPGSRFGNVPNNTYGIYNRENPDGFKWLHHDNEHTLGTSSSEQNMVTPFTSAGSQWRYFNPHWLHERLANSNADYRIHFADHVYKHFFEGGLMTPSVSQARISARAEQIRLAIIAESARWGDAKRYSPFTRDNHWQPEVNRILSNYLPGRTNTVLNQLKSVGWYPNVNPPTFSHPGGPVGSGFSLSMGAPYGQIYYTGDGSDPRRPGGSVNTASASVYNWPVSITASAHIKARILSGSTWSPLQEAVFAVDPVQDNLRITEIMFHPEDTNDPEDPNKEYIELKNVGFQTLNLNLVRFANGIDFTFGSLELGPGEYILVVKKRSVFEGEYGTGLNIAGQYTGSLNNGGERIRLEDPIGRTILDFEYKDGWRPITDGGGFSLTIIDPTNTDPNSWSEKDSWRASAHAGGSPGLDDSGILPDPGSVVINEVLAHSHDAAPDWIELYNATGADIDIGGWFLSDTDSDLMKYEIAEGTKIRAYNYLVFYEDVNFGEVSVDPGRHEGFGLSENGEGVYLSSAEGGVLTGYRDVEDFGASETGVSFGRYFKSSTGNYNFVSMSAPTISSGNAEPLVGPIVISEIMYNPDWPDGGSHTNNQYEYVELRNISGEAVTLYDDLTDEPWKFTDGIDFTFPYGSPVSIPAGGYLLVVKNPAAFTWRYPSVPQGNIVGPYEGQLSDAGEKLELSKPGDLDEYGTRQYIRVDRVNYSDGSHPEDCPGGVDLWPAGADGAGKSLARKVLSQYGNDVANWQAADPPPVP